MSPAEIRAYNAGVYTVLGLARATVDALAPRLERQPTRINFAMAALDGLADEARALLLSTSETSVPIPVRLASSAPHLPAPVAALQVEARTKGYTGEACSSCSNFTLIRNGTCLRCDTCGSTTGCS